MRNAELALPSRHLGLVQAGEHPQLEMFIERAANWVSAGVDVDELVARAGRAAFASQGGVHAALSSAIVSSPQPVQRAPLHALGQRIAVARDAAFGFRYALTIDGWREQGAEISFFAPLADEAPPPDADAVYLPGGYPELHAGHLSAAKNFIAGMREAAARGVQIYGECGGFMVLGDSLQDGDGIEHAMCGLLPVSTSFAEPQMTLGYREVELVTDTALGLRGQRFRGHEFHFARIAKVDDCTQGLFNARSANGDELGRAGLSRGRVFGSFIHLVDRVDCAAIAAQQRVVDTI